MRSSRDREQAWIIEERRLSDLRALIAQAQMIYDDYNNGGSWHDVRKSITELEKRHGINTYQQL